ncbi:hypothetical protein M1413_00930 [Patescibacteria group bacterium]|nr:hypothetical protein [Patescibacteria group bacterium]MCL5114319.1 hypothetical protein [Patescibacteria group bacterium]
MENKILGKAEKDGLVFKYIRLAINKKNGANGEVRKEMEEIRKILNMSHGDIIKEAKRLTTGA